MNKKTVGNIIAFILICLAILPSIKNLPLPIPTPTPTINLDINKPTKDILDKVKKINLLITDSNDRLKIAVFNYCFSKRVSNYQTDIQKLNDVYVKAAENYFNDTLKNKYSDLGSELTKLFIDILGTENHILSEDEKVQLKNTFGGLAWSLIQ